MDDNGIAVIMGNEVAHALACHGAERISQEMGAQVDFRATALAAPRRGCQSPVVVRARGLDKVARPNRSPAGIRVDPT